MKNSFRMWSLTYEMPLLVHSNLHSQFIFQKGVNPVNFMPVRWRSIHVVQKWSCHYLCGVEVLAILETCQDKLFQFDIFMKKELLVNLFMRYSLKHVHLRWIMYIMWTCSWVLFCFPYLTLSLNFSTDVNYALMRWQLGDWRRDHHFQQSYNSTWKFLCNIIDIYT